MDNTDKAKAGPSLKLKIYVERKIMLKKSIFVAFMNTVTAPEDVNYDSNHNICAQYPAILEMA